MILMRETTPATIRCGTVVETDSTPSMRKRTRRARPSGSKWMSEAPRSAACATIELTSLTTGASSADSRRSTTSPPSSSCCASCSSTASRTESPKRSSRAISAAMSSDDATPGRTS